MVGRALATCLFLYTVYGAIIPDQDERIKRIARCDDCNEAFQKKLHPPQPPFFHTQQWSGVARNPDGSQQQVFSGAAAAANANGGAQTSNEAFSLASSSVNSGSRDHESNKGSNKAFSENGHKNIPQDGLGDFEQGGNLQQTQSHKFDEGQHVQSKDFGSAASSQSQSANDQPWNETKYGSNHVGRYKSSVGPNGRSKFNSPRNDSPNPPEDEQNSRDGSFDAAQHQIQHSDFGINAGQQQAYDSRSNKGAFRNGIQTRHRHIDPDFESDTQGVQKSYFNEGRWENENNGGYDKGRRTQLQTKSSSSNDAGIRDEGQSTLHGALDLASQSLQSSQQLEQGQPGCSTCSKSNYALSNAKSKSGNAVAVSIGG